MGAWYDLQPAGEGRQENLHSSALGRRRRNENVEPI